MADNDNVFLEWIKEATAEIKGLREDLQKTREEFVVFKTKVNTRTALISVLFATIISVSVLIANVYAIKQAKRDIEKIEHLNNPDHES